MSKTLEQNLCSRSFGYAFVRNIFARPLLHLFYRKIDIIGAKDVPDTGPVIFAPNHQNALMDALVILCAKNRQPVFVARADIFQKPMIAAILNFLRILPIYRKRDGGNSSDNNQETFDLLPKVLHARYAVGIMPEGNHNEIKRLRMLQKGIFRIAMLAQEKYGNSSMVKIIPVGIEYTSTNKFRSDVMIRFGTAIELSDFYNQYAENQARAFKQMQDALMEKMREGMIDITSDQYYREIERLRVLYMDQALQQLGMDCRKAEDRLVAQQKIIAALQKHEQTQPDDMQALCLEVRTYLDGIEKHRLNDWVIERQPASLMGLLARCVVAILGIPFWILGVILNYPPYKISFLASRNVKDPQFISSVQFVAGLVLYPLYHLIAIVLMVLFIPCIWGKFVMVALIVPLGVIAYEYTLSIKKLIMRFRFWFSKRNKKTEIMEIIGLRKSIFDKMKEVLGDAGSCS